MTQDSTNSAPLWQRFETAPKSGADGNGPEFVRDLVEAWRKAGVDDQTIAALDNATVCSVLEGVAEGSRHLSMVMTRRPEIVAELLISSPEVRMAAIVAGLRAEAGAGHSRKEWMKRLRDAKSEAGLLIALCDLAGVWPVMQVTRALTELADAACEASVDYLFREAHLKGDWTGSATDGSPAQNSGYFVLAMGKHGAFELNYSSDIDLIVFYDPLKAQLRDGLELATLMVRITRDLVRLLNERTGDGYVFRTDLRLRPDPGATQVAMSTDAALHYYESFGQNWERAAMIKARCIAGDREAGEAFLKDLAPFVWRKYLDFAAIADVHAMKRQIHAHRGFARIAVAGHNIKLGRGGIREIEFFAQTQQLIAGGRQPELRVSRTLEALDALVTRGWIEEAVRDDLADAYRFLRGIEHRIQMVADEQTHQLPQDGPALEALARFSGYEELPSFEVELTTKLETVQRHYAALFEDGPELATATANLVLAGEDDDPDTLAVLAEMGFSQPAQVLATVRTWHRGRFAAVRSEGARARLTEVQPLLIEALSKTVNPDAALAGFDRFLSSLPAGIQLFALLKAHPQLMRLIATIMGSAPRLATILSRRRRVFDAVLDPRIIGNLPTEDEMAELIGAEMRDATSIEEVLDRARVVGREQMFLIGVRLLTGLIGADQAGPAYAVIAEQLIRHLQSAIEEDFRAKHGAVPGGAACVVAMGKLGSREMTATSDLDLIVVYDADEAAKNSDGARPLPVTQYYARLTQRLISAISAQTAEGRLFDVDMRLRPSGNQGPVATRLPGFISYQDAQAWTWEHMALTRARVVSGPEHLSQQITDAISATLRKAREPERIAADVHDMRERIWGEKGSDRIWELKQARGGTVDLEFIAQYLQLVHGHAHPEILKQNTLAAITALHQAGILDATTAEELTRAGQLFNTLSQLIRLCFEGRFDPSDAPDGLRRLLADSSGEPDFVRLEVRLGEALAAVRRNYERLIPKTN